MSAARIEIGQTKQGGCLKTLRRCAGLAPRAAREVDAENQYLDGHGLMVVAGARCVKSGGRRASMGDDHCQIFNRINVIISTPISKQLYT
jgi:hypothetical protein